MSDSILDQVITAKQKAAIIDFDPEDIIKRLFTVLSDREREIISRRHGLFEQPKATLEEIGKQHKVTRERVRQVENSSLKKIKENYDREILKVVENLANSILQEYQGIMTEHHLIDELLQVPGHSESHKSAVTFIMNQLLADRFQSIKETSEYHKAWASLDASWDKFLNNLRQIVKLVEDKNKPITLDDLSGAINQAEHIDWTDLSLEQTANIADVAKKIDRNIYNEYGHIDWSTIKPKRMNDKIYLVLKKAGKPMHFTEIAEEINKAKFDSRVAYPATIHNELILDNKFVLVGRGIYALTEWGYKPGVVTDVIAEILRRGGKPLTKEEIIEQVLNNRIVKRSTVILALMNKDKFTKNPDKTYSLKG